jgi:hypothetical protein
MLKRDPEDIDLDESGLFSRPGMLTIGGLALDLLESRFPLRRRGHIHALDETALRLGLRTVRQIDPAQAIEQRRYPGCWSDNDRNDRALRAECS